MFLLQFFHHVSNLISIADVLISNVIHWPSATSSFSEASFIAIDSRPAPRIIEENKVYANTVDFDFETFRDVSLTEEESSGVPLDPSCSALSFPKFIYVCPFNK